MSAFCFGIVLPDARFARRYGSVGALQFVGSMGELLETAALRGQIARFLHRHKNDENTAAVAAIRPETVHDDADLRAASIARWDDEGAACRMPEQAMRKRQNTDGARG